jgi:magnesium chelatase family protein
MERTRVTTSGGQLASARPLIADVFLLTSDPIGFRKLIIYKEFDAAGGSMLRAVVQQLNLSARSHHRALKLSRTIADLAGLATVQPAHVAEALRFRPRPFSA